MSDQRVLLGNLVRNARTTIDLTQEQVARRARIGTSSLRQIEAGRADGPSLYSVLRLFAALGIDVSELETLTTQDP